jgi:hypothetical protein
MNNAEMQGKHLASMPTRLYCCNVVVRLTVQMAVCDQGLN